MNCSQWLLADRCGGKQMASKESCEAQTPTLLEQHLKQEEQKTTSERG
jgi:hypothetical protein